MALAGSVLTLLGSIVFLLAALGLVRMPDVYNRIQAGTKATTLGLLLWAAGLCLIEPGWAPKVALMALFVLLTNPISSHALARAAHACGIPLAEGSVTDALAERRAAEAKTLAATDRHQPAASEAEPTLGVDSEGAS